MHDHREIVAHENAGEAIAPPELGEKVEDLSLDGDIKRGGGLIEEQDKRIEDQRAGDRNALALAAGELMWIAEPVRRQEPDVGDRCGDLFVDVALAVNFERLPQDVVDGLSRM
jgi:hypothetical protein